MSLKIFTDAASNLYPALLKEKGSSIEVIPMTLIIGDKEYVCYDGTVDVETMSKSFYDAMRAGGKPHTSLPSIGLLSQRFGKAVSEGHDVLFVSLSSGISGTFQAASLVAASINEEAGKERVAVLDSKTAGLGEGMIALYAEKLANGGATLSEAFEKTSDYVSHVRSEFTVDSIKYLASTGRVSNFTAILASVLLIKPLLYGSDEGKIVVTSKAQGRKNSLKRLAEQVLVNIGEGPKHIYITHCDALDDATYLANLLKEKGYFDIEIHPYDLVTGSHVGPGTIAIFYEGEKRSIERTKPAASTTPSIAIPSVMHGKKAQ